MSSVAILAQVIRESCSWRSACVEVPLELGAFATMAKDVKLLQFIVQKLPIAASYGAYQYKELDPKLLTNREFDEKGRVNFAASRGASHFGSFQDKELNEVEEATCVIAEFCEEKLYVTEGEIRIIAEFGAEKWSEGCCKGGYDKGCFKGRNDIIAEFGAAEMHKWIVPKPKKVWQRQGRQG